MFLFLCVQYFSIMLYILHIIYKHNPFSLKGFHFEKKHDLLGFKPVNRKSINSKRLGQLTMTTIC